MVTRLSPPPREPGYEARSDPGLKCAEYKEMEKGQVILVARDCTGVRVTVDNGRVVSAVKEMMDSIHSRLFDK